MRSFGEPENGVSYYLRVMAIEKSQRTWQQLAQGYWHRHHYAKMFLVRFTIVSIERYKVADIVRQDRALLAYGKVQLLHIGYPAAPDFGDMDDIVAALPENFCKWWPNVLIQQKSNLGHLPVSGREVVCPSCRADPDRSFLYGRNIKRARRLPEPGLSE